MSDATLGDVLIQLGFVTREQLHEIQDRLTNATAEEKWGNQLIAHDLITNDQLDQALQVYRDLGSTDPHTRSMAAMEIVSQQTDNVTNLAQHVASKAAQVCDLSQKQRRETGQAFPAVATATIDD